MPRDRKPGKKRCKSKQRAGDGDKNNPAPRRSGRKRTRRTVSPPPGYDRTGRRLRQSSESSVTSDDDVDDDKQEDMVEKDTTLGTPLYGPVTTSDKPQTTQLLGLIIRALDNIQSHQEEEEEEKSREPDEPEAVVFEVDDHDDDHSSDDDFIPDDDASDSWDEGDSDDQYDDLPDLVDVEESRAQRRSTRRSTNRTTTGTKTTKSTTTTKGPSTRRRTRSQQNTTKTQENNTSATSILGSSDDDSSSDSSSDSDSDTTSGSDTEEEKMKNKKKPNRGKSMSTRQLQDLIQRSLHASPPRNQKKNSKHSPPRPVNHPPKRRKNKRRFSSLDGIQSAAGASVAATAVIKIPSVRTSRSLARKRRRAAFPNSALPAPPFTPTDLKSLIRLAKMSRKTLYRDCQRLTGLIKPLEELESMIGLSDIKQRIVDLVIRLLQKKSLALPAMQHTLVYGPPGVGKTRFIGILAKVFAALGAIKHGNVVHATKANLVGAFLGQTAPKTEKVLNSAIGGVVVVDEAYGLADGRSDGSGDSFSKECLDTMNAHLSKHGSEYVAVFAGYRDAIERDVLSVNPGLSRRFVNTFEITGYSGAELRQIMLSKLREKSLALSTDADNHLNAGFFEQGKRDGRFKHFGGSVQTLCDEVVNSHAKNVFGANDKSVVSLSSIKSAWSAYGTQLDLKSKARTSAPPMHMYM